MKVLHLSFSDLQGGAARGAYGLHKGLQASGIDSTMLVSKKVSNDSSVYPSLHSKGTRFLRSKFDQAPLLLYPNRDPYIFSPAVVPSTVWRWIERINPDIVHLHWVLSGFIPPEVIARFKRPVVWTLRDMWPFTGGCHYSGACRQFEGACGACPHLSSDKVEDLSRSLWLRKAQAWSNVDLTLVGISNWISDCARQSSLFSDRRVETIHNAIDEHVFSPVPKDVARAKLGLEREAKLILFGAVNAINDSRKGFAYAQKALRIFRESSASNQVQVVVFGSEEPSNPHDLGFATTYLGHIGDDKELALVYSAADVMLVPSVQEAFGKTAIEAMACGTPVVSFDSTGLRDIVVHGVNGYRAACFDSADLAAGLKWVLEDNATNVLSRNSRAGVLESFTLTKQAREYAMLYAELIRDGTP